MPSLAAAPSPCWQCAASEAGHPFDRAGLSLSHTNTRAQVEVWVAADAAAEEELALAEVGKRLQTAALAPR